MFLGTKVKPFKCKYSLLLFTKRELHTIIKVNATSIFSSRYDRLIAFVEVQVSPVSFHSF